MIMSMEVVSTVGCRYGDQIRPQFRVSPPFVPRGSKYPTIGHYRVSSQNRTSIPAMENLRTL